MKKEEDKARREFIKQEYLRRKQLKLMADMDMLVKSRPATAKQRKPRPKSIHRDVIESPKTAVRATAGKGADALYQGKTHVLCTTLSFCFLAH
ncbi:calmodulin-regulated spectrin-associated protein 2a isoform X1 [Tachysurus ichikawai]